jgi:hypothetical protein
MLESIEILEHLANPNKPPLSVGELEDIRIAFLDPDSDKDALRESLKGMTTAFQGRGDVSEWHYEMLDAIDECFVDQYMKTGEISTALFVPNSAANLNDFSAYCEAVDQKIRSNGSQRPKYAREYFAYFSIWQMQGYSFPVPLGTKSVIRALDTLAEVFNPGFVEVSYIAKSWSVRMCRSDAALPPIGESPIGGRNRCARTYAICRR